MTTRPDKTAAKDAAQLEPTTPQSLKPAARRMDSTATTSSFFDFGVNPFDCGANPFGVSDAPNDQPMPQEHPDYFSPLDNIPLATPVREPQNALMRMASVQRPAKSVPSKHRQPLFIHSTESPGAVPTKEPLIIQPTASPEPIPSEESVVILEGKPSSESFKLQRPIHHRYNTRSSMAKDATPSPPSVVIVESSSESEVEEPPAKKTQKQAPAKTTQKQASAEKTAQKKASAEKTAQKRASAEKTRAPDNASIVPDGDTDPEGDSTAFDDKEMRVGGGNDDGYLVELNEQGMPVQLGGVDMNFEELHILMATQNADAKREHVFLLEKTEQQRREIVDLMLQIAHEEIINAQLRGVQLEVAAQKFGGGAWF